MSENEPLLLSLPATARALGVSRRTVERLIVSGHLPKVKVGGASRIPVDAVKHLATPQVTQARPDARVIPLPARRR